MTLLLFGDLVAEAYGTIRGNPLRAGLAALAVAAAVATMSVVVTALEGVERSARQATARSFGSDTFVIARVFPGQLGRKALVDALRRNPDVTRSDVRFLGRHADGDVLYAPFAQRGADVVAGGLRFENASIVGTSSLLAELRDVSLERGRFFGAQEDFQASQVAVIGADVADSLFPSRDPIGGTVRVGLRGFVVVGVQGRQGTSGGASLDRNVWIPLAAWERIFGAPEGLQVFARAAREGRFADAEDRARATMRARRALGPGVDDNFNLLAPEAARSFVQNVSTRISVAAVPISIMAMLAAIVVVTNTILVSVTQRTREIGIRRAVGGSRLHVTVEIVTESAMVAMAGGLAGVAAGAGLLAAASRAIGFGLPLQPATIGWSLAAAMASGIVAAWYPARRAARFDVVAALHQD